MSLITDAIVEEAAAVSVELHRLQREGKFCGVGVCTGTQVSIPLVTREGSTPPVSLQITACLFCLDDLQAAFPNATITL